MQLRSPTGYGMRMLRSVTLGRPALIIAAIYPTYRCNLRCAYCNFPAMAAQELETDQWRSIFDQLAGLGCRRVAILGGEPLLRNDLADLIAHVHQAGMSCVLTSNGLLVPAQIKRLRQLDTLVLSLDAAGPENDAVRGEGVLEAVKKAVAAAQNEKIPVKINAALSARTSSSLNSLLSLIDEHNLYITLNIMRSGNPGLWKDAASIKDEDETIRATLLKIARLTKHNPRILFSEQSYRYAAQWDDFAKDRYEARELAPDSPLIKNGPRCQAGRYYMTILPDGTASPCMNTIGTIQGGNVLHDGVETAWTNLHDHSCTACYAPCLVEQNYLFSLKPRVLLSFIAKHFLKGNFL
jgi:MoaA/NifB/PqqE/SkfB family radical SAM enzyme